MRTPKDLREYYDREYYQEPEIGNPAHVIYDGLRVQVIREFISGASGRGLIVGCGSNRDMQIFPPDGQTVAFDLSFEAVRKIHVQDTVSLLTADALQIPFSEKTFDIVVCSEVLEHIPGIRQAVEEFHRVLKPGGLLVVSSPNWTSWFGLARWISETIFRKSIHSDGQPYDDWKTLARYKQELSPDFSVLEARGVWYLPPLHFRRRGLPRAIVRGIYFFYAPLERVLSRWFPGTGHLIVLKCISSAAGARANGGAT